VSRSQRADSYALWKEQSDDLFKRTDGVCLELLSKRHIQMEVDKNALADGISHIVFHAFMLGGKALRYSQIPLRPRGELQTQLIGVIGAVIDDFSFHWQEISPEVWHVLEISSASLNGEPGSKRSNQSAPQSAHTENEPYHNYVGTFALRIKRTVLNPESMEGLAGALDFAINNGQQIRSAVLALSDTNGGAINAVRNAGKLVGALAAQYECASFIKRRLTEARL